MIPSNVPFEEALRSMTSKEPADLTEDEKAFIRARKFYLTAGELNKFKSLFAKKAEEKVEESK